MKDQAIMILRGQMIDIIMGSVFVFIGLVAASIAAIRRRPSTRIFVWLGIWSAIYGGVQLSQSPLVIAASPRWLQTSAPYANTAMEYLKVVVACLAFMELSIGRLRFLYRAVAALGAGIAVAGMGLFVFSGSNDKLMRYNNLLATVLLLALLIVVASPKLSKKYLVLSTRGVLVIGLLVFTVEALYVNLVRPLHLGTPRILDHLAFAMLLFSFGYVALKGAFANERRLLSVENELAIAHEIQASILPPGVPEIDNLSISAAYHPMTAVAGDFYEFIPVDQKRVGILVADVSGHGVPAALIASMIKVAIQSLVAFAPEPRAVLCGLNRILSAQLHAQFVSTAYLWLDTEIRTLRYSAAGHPPLLRWRQGKLDRIESNGLLFGVIPDYDDYPVCTMPISPGDRFLLYTDGVTEPENARGEPFGEARLEQVVRHNQCRRSSELSDQLLSEIRHWQPAPVTQQDDITLIIIDVVEPCPVVRNPKG